MLPAIGGKKRRRPSFGQVPPDPHRELAHHGQALRRTTTLLGELVSLLVAPPADPSDSWQLVNDLIRHISTEFDTMWKRGYDHYESTFNMTPEKLQCLKAELWRTKCKLAQVKESNAKMKAVLLEHRLTLPHGELSNTATDTQT